MATQSNPAHQDAPTPGRRDFLYIATGATLAQILNDRGNAQEAMQVFNTVKGVAQAVRIQTSAELPPPTPMPLDSGLPPGDSPASRQLPLTKKKP